MFAGCLFLVGCKKEGCTNSAATNYDKKAKEDNNTCEYTVSGLWNVVSYVLSSTEIMDSYSSLTMDLRSDGSSKTVGLLLNGRTITVDGVWTLTDSTLQLTNSSGDKTIWTISFIDGRNMTMNSDNVGGFPAKMVFTR